MVAARSTGSSARGEPDEQDQQDEPILAVTAVQWGAWLAKHHAKSDGAWLTLTKAGVKPATLSYAEALDYALAWGWIDGHKRALDARAWLQRFTPRRPRSNWSKINCGKAEVLIRDGRMRPPGLAEVARARQDGRWAAAYDSPRTSQVPVDLEAALAANQRARAFFEALDGANRYAILYRLQTAKKPETRTQRLEIFVRMLAKGETLHPPRASTKAKRLKSRSSL
jgi:uncharacterized protein YdeI (YjbR/CyaY-like superfamily)